MKYVGKNGLKVGDNEVWHEGNLEIGGRNLIRNSDFSQGLNRWSNQGSGVCEIINGILNISGTREPYQGMGDKVNVGDIVTASAMVRGTGTIGFRFGNEDKPLYAITSEFKKYTRTWVRSGNANFIISQTEGEAEIKNVKLEKGTIATDWTPAPEDVQAEIDGKVDKSQVLTNVPANAKFTDTTYTEISESEINTGTASTLRTITARRIKFILDKVQGWINGLTKTDVGLGNVDNIQQASKTEFTAHNNDTTKHITSTERTAWNNKWNYNENTIKAVKVNNAVNADTVNGKTVAVNVPSDAKFTDTVTTINGKTGTITKADITALGIPAQDTVYTHPTTAGNKHIPAGGASGQFLKWSANGTATWDSVPGGLSLGETSGTAYRGDRGKVAYDHSQNAAVHIKTVTSATEPSNLNAGDQWHKEI